jgi:hypothetical protein
VYVLFNRVPCVEEKYGEYPYVSTDEIKKALKLKAAFSRMFDLM